MPFPWGQSFFPTITCEFCGQSFQKMGTSVVHCHCLKSEQKRQEDISRLAHFAALRQEAQPSMNEIKQQRKLRSR